MARSQTNAYWTQPVSASSDYDFTRLGHPGRYTSVIKHVTGELWLTGSNFGHGGAMMIGSGSSTTFGTEDKISLSGGGDILLRDFASIHGSATNEIRTSILEVSVAYVSSSVQAPHIYFFKRQQ
jgi:hypothetical protein